MCQLGVAQQQVRSHPDLLQVWEGGGGKRERERESVCVCVCAMHTWHGGNMICRRWNGGIGLELEEK